MWKLITVVAVLQPIVGTSHTSIIDPVLGLLKSLHLEVQFEGIYCPTDRNSP